MEATRAIAAAPAPQRVVLIILAWSVLLSLAVYWPVLSLPFFFDDLDHIPFAVENSYWTLLTSAGDFPYFRPIGVLSLRVVADLFGRYNTVAQHASGLLLHMLNGWLAGVIAGYWVEQRQKLLAGLLAASFFLIFPFSYQVVPWVDARYHPLVLLFMLLSLIAVRKVWAGGGAGWWGLGLATAATAPLVHENGLVLGPLVLLLALFEGSWRKNVRSVLAWQAMTALGLGAALWGAPSSDGLAVVSAETIYQNITYFSQGISYPIGWLGGRLVNAGFNDFRVVWTTVLLAALLLAFGAARSQSKLPIAFALAWFAAASGLSVLLLDFGYVIDGPRLLYVGSVGVAWAWALVLIGLLGQRNHQNIRIAAILFAALILSGSIRYMRQQMTIHTTLGDGYNSLIAAAQGPESDDFNAVYVNMIDWLTADVATFALGHEGVMFRPDYIDQATVLKTALPLKKRHQFVRNDATMPNLPYVFGAGGAGLNQIEPLPSQVFAMRYSEPDKTLAVIEVGTINASHSLEIEAAVFFDSSSATSSSIQLDQPSLKIVNETLIVRMTWQTRQPISATTTVFVHLLDANGQLVGQADGAALGGVYPFSSWQDGEVVIDQRQIPLVDGVEVRIGIYDAASGERWDAVGEGVISAENALALPIAR